jgi:hypothetical protein
MHARSIFLTRAAKPLAGELLLSSSPHQPTLAVFPAAERTRSIWVPLCVGTAVFGLVCYLFSTIWLHAVHDIFALSPFPTPQQSGMPSSVSMTVSQTNGVASGLSIAAVHPLKIITHSTPPINDQRSRFAINGAGSAILKPTSRHEPVDVVFTVRLWLRA